MTMMIRSTGSRKEGAVPPESLDDEILLARMKLDDGDAYRVLVERHVDRAYALALRMLRNVADAEDVAQESMVKAWTHRQSWEPGRARFSTWLYRVVVNRCIDLRRLPSNANIDDVPEPAEDIPDTTETLYRREVYSRLERAIGKLPDQQRAAVTLAYFEDLGNGEIAQILGTTISAVESLLKRGRQGLRHALRGSESEFRQLLAEE
ncbi:sigma-70 family RNA polymerase sigma factor [Magnetospirillum molischianum]|uniref:RNA polymerase sigma factor n=1 Tax=Magnetospirillum molischianum DSM 120 TaxID=1150626 RepID=H8FWB6_MAGML|nr:sigma-70 family RNA polymerase sigma factor [Magnetospirillum molischianum]CCG42654.1 Putative RNA polymerase ECF-type sigma factor [Magnetospirillum molischianum DSM 120]